MRRWLSRFGVVGFAFFFIKGLVWLAVAGGTLTASTLALQTSDSSKDPTMTTTDAAGFSATLKSETQPLHDEAEAHEFQRVLLNGELPRETFVQFLEQMLIVHGALERELRAAASNVPAVGAVVQERYFQVPRLREDLAFHGGATSPSEPTPAVRRLVERIETAGRENPAALLGFLYVLEGSNNGGRIIAKKIAGAYGPESGEGLSFFDPHGRAQREYWKEFKQDLDAQPLSEADRAAILDAAKDTFRGVSAIGDDLLGAPTS